jgi:tetratricopeptide (TPR) repeat protein
LRHRPSSDSYALVYRFWWYSCLSIPFQHTRRQELAALNAQLAEAAAARDRAQSVIDRLAKPQKLLEEAVVQHAAEKADFDARLVEWYTNGCPGERPPTPPSLLLAEHRIGEARRDLGANENALETARDALQAAAEDLANSAQQQGALYRAAVRAAEARLHAHAVPALIAALNYQMLDGTVYSTGSDGVINAQPRHVAALLVAGCQFKSSGLPA